MAIGVRYGGWSQVVAEAADRGVVGNLVGRAEAAEAAERVPLPELILQRFVGEAVPVLEQQRGDHRQDRREGRQSSSAPIR